MIAYGIYLKNTRLENFHSDIFNLLKTYETRNRNVFKRLINNRVFLIDNTGKEKFVTGSVIIGSPLKCNSLETYNEKFREKTRVIPGSVYDFKPGKTKYLYPLISPEKLPEPVPADIIKINRSFCLVKI